MKGILKSANNFDEKLYTKQTYKAATTEFLSKFSNGKKMSDETFNLC